MLDQLDRNALKTEKPRIENKDVDLAFDQIEKNNDHFDDWKNRLKDYLEKGVFNFVNKVLITIAHKDSINIQEIYNIAQEFNQTEEFMNWVFDLEQDGYIVKNNDKYVFISPFLKSYWKRTNPII